MDCKCKNILDLQPKCTPTVDLQPKCNPVLNMSDNRTGTLYHDRLLHRDYPDQHPISSVTGLQEALDRLDTFIFEQGVASDEWTVVHNLNRFPSVTVVDSAGNEFFPEVAYQDENTCIIRMNGATTGKAYLN